MHTLVTFIIYYFFQECQDISGNPYYLDQDQIDELTMEIEELKVFSTEVRKILSDRRRGDRTATAESPGHQQQGHYQQGGAAYEGHN